MWNQSCKLGLIQLLLLCSGIVFCHQEGESCAPVDYPEFVDRSGNFFRFFLTSDLLIGDYHFGCNGLITKFEFYCRPGFDGAQTFEFQIWRRNLAIDDAEAYSLIGNHVLVNVKPSENNILSYSVPQDQQIKAEPGDIVGIRVYNATEPDPFQIQAHLVCLTREIVSYDLEENEVTPPFLNLDEVGTRSVFPRRVPVMRITTVPVPVSCDVESEQCKRVDYPDFVDRSRDLFQFQFSGPGQILVGAYRFSCSGFVTRFDLYCRGSGAQTAEFQVWRLNPPTNGMTTYTLVGKHVLPNVRPDSNNLLSYLVPEDEQIHVQPGDIVGLRAYNATEPDPFRVQAHLDLGANTADIRAIVLNENETTPEILNLDELETSALIPGRLPVMNITTVAASCRVCTPSGYPDFVDRSGDLIQFFLSGPGQILIGDYQFGCSGRVTKFEFYTRPGFSGALTFEFHVWRKTTTTEEKTVYTLVGKNVLPDARPGANNILSYSVPLGHQIQVQPGDIVGVRGYNAIEPNPFSLQAHLVGFSSEVVAYNLDESEATPAVLDLDEVGALLLLPRRVPVMRITVE